MTQKLVKWQVEFIKFMQKKPLLSIIAALSDNRVIGKDNRVPWRLKDDLIKLKKMTVGHVVILGKKTYESMLFYYKRSGKNTMSLRTHIVVTRDIYYLVDKENGFAVNSIEEALNKAYKIEKEEVFILGGEQIFNQTLPFVDRLYLTVVHAKIDGDAFFPNYSDFKKLIKKEDFKGEQFDYTFLTLER